MTLVATILSSRAHRFLTRQDNQHNGNAKPNPHRIATSKCRHVVLLGVPFCRTSFSVSVRSTDVLRSSALQPSRSLAGKKRFQKQRKKADKIRMSVSVSVCYQCRGLSLNPQSLCADSSFDPRSWVEWSEGTSVGSVRETIDQIIFETCCLLK